MKNSAVLITGSAKRIGREIAFKLAAKGFDIAIHYNKSKAEALKLADEIKRKFKVKAETLQKNHLNNLKIPIVSKIANKPLIISSLA